MINLKSFIVSILIPNLFGLFGSLIGNVSQGFDAMVKPYFMPPAIVFPIVWTILYILMGISSYIIYSSNSEDKKSALTIYSIQLIINSLWTFFFFNLEWYLFSFIWILIMIFFVVIMIYKFYKINRLAGLLQLPYLVWLVFASILNFSVYLLNR